MSSAIIQRDNKTVPSNVLVPEKMQWVMIFHLPKKSDMHKQAEINL